MSSNDFDDDHPVTTATLMIGQSPKHSTMELSKFDKRFSLSGTGNTELSKTSDVLPVVFRACIIAGWRRAHREGFPHQKKLWIRCSLRCGQSTK